MSKAKSTRAHKVQELDATTLQAHRANTASIPRKQWHLKGVQKEENIIEVLNQLEKSGAKIFSIDIKSGHVLYTTAASQ